MNILTAILGIFAKIMASVVASITKEALKTPATKEETHVQEGKASPVDDSAYDGLYGSRVRDRSEGDK